MLKRPLHHPVSDAQPWGTCSHFLLNTLLLAQEIDRKEDLSSKIWADVCPDLSQVRPGSNELDSIDFSPPSLPLVGGTTLEHVCNCWFLELAIKDLWSVCRVECCPSRKFCHSLDTHQQLTVGGVQALAVESNEGPWLILALPPCTWLLIRVALASMFSWIWVDFKGCCSVTKLRRPSLHCCKPSPAKLMPVLRNWGANKPLAIGICVPPWPLNYLIYCQSKPTRHVIKVPKGVTMAGFTQLAWLTSTW